MQKDLTELIEVFTEVDSYDKMQGIFNDMFTEKEKDDFALRWRLMKEIYNGKSQRAIAAELGISLCKITRGSKILREEDSLMKQLIKEHTHV